MGLSLAIDSAICVGGGTSPPPPVPLTIPGVAFWVRADRGITPGSGSNVAGWADQSGTGDAHKNLAQATGSAQPTLVASDAGYGGKPTISFAGASILLASQAWTSALVAPYTIFVVGHTTDNSTSNDYFFDTLTGTVQLNDLFGTGMALFAGAGPLNWGGHGTLNHPSLIVCIVNGASSSIAINTRTAGKTGDAGSTSLTSLVLGNLHGGGAANTLNGKIGEIGFYSGVASAGSIDTYATYVTSNYGIAVGA